MAYNINRHALDRAYHSAHSGISLYKDKAASHGVGGKVVSTLVSGGSAFGWGFLSGYAGAQEIFGMPVDLATGLLLQFGAYTGWLGKGGFANVAADIGRGGTDSYMNRLGAAVGDGMRRKAGRRILRPAFPSSSGAYPVVGGQRRPITDAELASMAAANRG